MGDKSHDDEQMAFGGISEIAIRRYYEHNGKASQHKNTTKMRKRSKFLPMLTYSSMQVTG